MSVKASLRVVLLADEVTIAESDDAALWQHILSTVTGRRGETSPAPNFRASRAVESTVRPGEHPHSESENKGVGSTALERFGEVLTLNSTIVQGACDPSMEPPYMHLHMQEWQDFRRKTPSRGYTSIPPIVLAATLLVLWFKEASLGTVTIRV